MQIEKHLIPSATKSYLLYCQSAVDRLTVHLMMSGDSHPWKFVILELMLIPVPYRRKHNEGKRDIVGGEKRHRWEIEKWATKTLAHRTKDD